MGNIELTVDGVVKLLQARLAAEEAKIYPLTLFTDPKVIALAAENNENYRRVANVLMEMIGAIYSIRQELSMGKIVWPMDDLDTLVKFAKQEGLVDGIVQDGISDYKQVYGRE